MSRRVRNILIVIFLILVIGLTSYTLLKMNHFDFKKLEFSNVKQSEKDIKEKEEIPDDFEEMLPDDDDVLPSADDLLPSEEDVTVPNDGLTSVTNSGTNSTKTTTKQTTTKKTENNQSSNTSQNTGMPSVSTAKFDTEINSVKLNPIKTRRTTLDNKIANIINSVTNSSMTNNQKLYAVFKYIMDHSEYGITFYSLVLNDVVDQYHYTYFDGNIVTLAEEILETGHGVCDHYAALFVVMARRLGFDAYWVAGSVKKAGGGTTGHAWANILVNGTYYVFDPQIADRRPEQEKYYYGKTDQEINIYTYNNRESYVKSFNSFKETAPLKLDVKLSGAVNDTKSISSYSRNILQNVEYNAFVGEMINFNIKTSGASKYTYDIRVKPTNVTTDSLYSKKNDTSNNLNLSYKFDNVGGYAVYISVWNSETSVYAEYYFFVNVTTDDRIKDINVTYSTKTENKNNMDYYYVTFKSEVVKYDQTSTCIPEYEYTILSTDKEGGLPYVFASVDGGNLDSFRYYPGYTYNVKVKAKCGSEMFEKTITFKE